MESGGRGGGERRRGEEATSLAATFFAVRGRVCGARRPGPPLRGAPRWGWEGSEAAEGAGPRGAGGGGLGPRASGPPVPPGLLTPDAGAGRPLEGGCDLPVRFRAEGDREGVRVDGDSEVHMLPTWWETCFPKREVAFRNPPLSLGLMPPFSRRCQEKGPLHQCFLNLLERSVVCGEPWLQGSALNLVVFVVPW